MGRERRPIGEGPTSFDSSVRFRWKQSHGRSTRSTELWRHRGKEKASGDWGLKGAFIQIMALTWDSFLCPSWTGSTSGSQSDWFPIGSAARLAMQDLNA